MKEKKRRKAGVAVKQQKNSEKQQFVLQYRGNISHELVENLNKIRPVQTILTTRKLKSFHLALNPASIKTLNPTLFMKSLVRDSNSSM